MEKETTNSKVEMAERIAHPPNMLTARINEEAAIPAMDPMSKSLWLSLSNKQDAPKVTSKLAPEIPALRYFAELGRRSWRIETP